MTTHNSNPTESYLQEIAEKIESGHASVMIGAGFSKNASEKFPSWNDLGIAFYKKLHNNKNPKKKEYFLNPMKLAGEIKEDFGYQTLFEIIKSNIPDKEYKPSDLHIKLLKLPWRDVFTTNYDTLLERASEQVINFRFDVVRTKDELPFSNSPRIIKLHGCLDHQKELIITDDDYREFPNKFAPLVNTVLQSLIENTLCLIGFSGEDPNFLNWLSWILNNLGQENSPKIYLIGKLDLNQSQKKWLEKRNINVVDLTLFDNISHKSHKEAFSSFFDYITRFLTEKNKLNWPKGFSEQANNRSKVIKEILPTWTKQRHNYPNWFILPEENRKYLWEKTVGWIHEIPNVENLKFPYDFSFIYELNWRLEKCLFPIESDAIEFYERITEKYSIGDSLVHGNDKIFKIQWIELKLAILRYYREEALFEKWEHTNNIIFQNKELCTSELIARWNYEKVLYYLFRLDFEKSIEILKEWNNDETLLIWEVKRSCLLAEFGEIKEAVDNIENALIKIRKKLNLSPVKNDFLLVSIEAYTIILHHYISLSMNVLDRNFSEDVEKREEEYDRLDILKSYKCDPWKELKLFELKISNKNTNTYPTISYGFDIGNVTRTINYGPDQNNIDALTFQRFYEEAGIPFGLPGVNPLGKKALDSAIKLLSSLSPHWALITLLRIGDYKLTDELFNRFSISIMGKAVIDNLSEQYIRILENAISNLDKPNEKILAEKHCKLILEIISRLLSKSSIHVKDKFLNILSEIYNSKNKWAFQDLSTILKRLINSYTENELVERINLFLNFPILSKETNRIDEYFPEPFKFLKINKLKIDKLNTAELIINNLINKVVSPDIIERSNALLRLGELNRWNCLNKNHKETLGQKIWSMVNIHDEFPNFKFLYKSAFINLPHPKNISPEKKIKNYLQSNNIPVQNDENSFQKFNGELEWPILLYNSSKKINNTKGIVWSFDELISLFERLYFWWDHDKKFLLRNDTNELVSISNEFRLRFKHFVNILAEMIIPNLPVNVDESLKIKIKNLIYEMQEFRLPCMKAKIASLIIFPEDISEIEKQIHEKISEANIAEVENTFMGIYFNINAHKLKKSILLPNSIFETISQNVKWRSQPALFYALDLFVSILNTSPELLNDKILFDILIGLKNLINDTDLTNENSLILPFETRIEIKEFASRLAFELYLYHLNNKKDIPEAINIWKRLCENPEEFVEFRKQWNSKLPK